MQDKILNKTLENDIFKRAFWEMFRRIFNRLLKKIRMNLKKFFEYYPEHFLE